MKTVRDNSFISIKISWNINSLLGSVTEYLKIVSLLSSDEDRITENITIACSLDIESIILTCNLHTESITFEYDFHAESTMNF